MDFDTASFLNGLFGGKAPAAVPEGAAVGPQATTAAPAGDGPGAIATAGGAAAVPEGNPEEIEYIEPPAPCPCCGSLELWQDLLGGWHCQHCEAAALGRSRDLADRAARLRKQSNLSRRGAG